ncbi:MAG: DMT family transporter [Planctomycetes bacterium]|nr:DMT family transporter [Planctomycetota bacterium]
MQNRLSHDSHHLLGLGATLASVLFFVVMNVLTKYLSDIPSSQKVMYRMLVGVLGIVVLVRVGIVKWRFGHIGLLCLRGTLGAVTVLFYFYSIDHTTLGRASFLLFTYPAWGALFSYLFLKEPLGWKRLPGMVLIYAGAFAILASRSAAGGEGVTLAGDLSGLAAGFVSGAATTTIRALHRYDSTWIIMFFFVFFGMTAGAGVTFATGTYVAPSHIQWLILLGIGLTSLAAHAFFTIGFRYLDVATVGAVAMLQSPLSAAAAWLVLAEDFSRLAIAGGALVLAGGAYLAKTSRARTMQRKDQAAQAPAPHD